MSQPTRTPETMERYLSRAAKLLARAAKEMQLPAGQTPSIAIWVNWAISQRANIRAPTWRQYRAAMIFYLQQSSTAESLAGIAQLRAADCSQCLRRRNSPPRTSSHKMKEFKIDDLSAVLTWLRSHQGRWSGATALWLQAGLLTGLRPAEWRQAELAMQAGQTVLVVKNAKNTNGRAHGTTRHVILAGLEESQILAIRGMLLWVHHVLKAGLWDIAYEGCRKTLHRANHWCHPGRRRYPTLYSTRHQFAADAKQNGITPGELAALMGHATTETAYSHYGRRRHGRRGFAVRADPDDVARVADRPVTRNQRIGGNRMSNHVKNG